MLVSLAILTILSAVLLSSHASFSNSIIITNAAYDVALSLRNAEGYGIGSRGYGAVVNTGYGLDFTPTTPTSYRFFADTSPAAGSSAPDAKPGDGVYTAGQDALVTTYRIGDGITISDFCGLMNGNWKCASQGNSLTQMDIVFTRPNATPTITGIIGASTHALSAACLTLSTPQGSSRYVSVSLGGLVSAVATSCP